MSRLVLLLCSLPILWACPPSDSADLAADPEGPQPTVDMDQPEVGLTAIKKRGKLRLLTRNNSTSYFVWHGQMMGADYELARDFADQLGVDLETVVPENWSDLLPALRAGEGDIAAASISVTQEREQLVRFSKPIKLTQMRIVWRKGQTPINEPQGLSGRTIHVRENSEYYRRLERLSNLFATTGRKPIDIVIESETLETEQIVEEVAAGRIPYTVCDYHICQVNRSYLPDLVIGARLGDPQPLAWAVHKKAPDLANAIDAFIDKARADGRLREIEKRYFEMTRGAQRGRGKQRSAAHKGKLSPHDPLFRAAQRQFGIDWRLMASLAYQESRFNPKAGSWTRGQGLFGMLEPMARKLGHKGLTDPNVATSAAATYFVELQMPFTGVANVDDRLRLTVAAFNCGPEHLTDARLLASQQRLNPDQWINVAKALRMLALPEYASKAEHGYVRGSHVVNYVDEVWDRYRAYRHATGERDK